MSVSVGERESSSKVYTVGWLSNSLAMHILCGMVGGGSLDISSWHG